MENVSDHELESLQNYYNICVVPDYNDIVGKLSTNLKPLEYPKITFENYTKFYENRVEIRNVTFLLNLIKEYDIPEANNSYVNLINSYCDIIELYNKFESNPDKQGVLSGLSIVWEKSMNLPNLRGENSVKVLNDLKTEHNEMRKKYIDFTYDLIVYDDDLRAIWKNEIEKWLEPWSDQEECESKKAEIELRVNLMQLAKKEDLERNFK